LVRQARNVQRLLGLACQRSYRPSSLTVYGGARASRPPSASAATAVEVIPWLGQDLLSRSLFWHVPLISQMPASAQSRRPTTKWLWKSTAVACWGGGGAGRAAGAGD